MKRFTLSIFLLLVFLFKTYGQDVNGVVVSSDNNLKVIKVWGTHEQRGYALGYLLADQIVDLYQTFIIPSFGAHLAYAKLIVKNPAHFSINSDYIAEATAMVEGIEDAGYDLNIDYGDILLANSFLDIANLSFLNFNLRNGCSSLISWGDATAGTNLDGKAVITRHMDWNDHPSIVRNQVMVIHLPSEENEQPWLLIGFAGQIAVLSGVNQSGLAVMQHMLADEYSHSSLNKAYEPIWFTLRKSIEKADYNGDGQTNAKDILNAITSNTNGYGDSYIVAGLAPANSGNDSLVAIIAEVAPANPYISVRYNTYPDSIPGDNLYAANFSISRNNYMHLCMRYDSVRTNMGNGTGIGYDESWNIMLNHSSSCAFGGPGNIQFMQYVPEDKMLKLAVHLNDGTQACENIPMVFNTDDLFQAPSTISSTLKDKPFTVYPNPFNLAATIRINIPTCHSHSIKIFSIDGQTIKKIPVKGNSMELSNLLQGAYIVGLFKDNKLISREKVIVH
jgi:hypothetical protein